MARSHRLGRWLRAARAWHGHTQADAAAQLDVADDRPSAWETGGERPTLASLVALERVYGRTPGLEAGIVELIAWLDEPVDVDAAESTP